MKYLVRATALMALSLSFSANAALISFVNKTTNDGVYTLSSDQAQFLGVAGADRIAFLRLREGSGVSWSTGDTFDLNTIFNSTNNDGKILGVFNGQNSNLTYNGGFLSDFTGAEINNDQSGFYEGIAFAFSSSAGNIVFNGTSTFNGGQTRGGASFIRAEIPEPSILAIMGIGLVGLGLRRRKNQ